ncbi:MAG: uroporphyrinogen-III synthase [Bacteroidales bacterium]|nr:uroporphyrinogen-III synthase [Bacteroidales bacterium]
MRVKNILISQNAPADFEKSPYADLKRKYSINIDFYKFFKIEGVDAVEFRKTKVNILDHQAIIFSSKNTIDHFFELCKDMRLTMPESMKYFCTTEAVAFYLQKYIQYRKRKIFAAKDSHPASFHEILLKNKELNMLIPCGQDGTSQHLLDFLDEHSIRHDQAVVFTTSPADLAKEVDIVKYDMIVMFSPNGVKSLKANFPDFQQGDVAFAALGTAVINELEAAGWTAQVVAPTPDHPSITDALDAFLKENATRRR